MKIESCKTYIEHALDVFAAKEKTLPQIKFIPEEEKLSTKPDYGNQPTLYVVANE
ncbi:hypothetical protein OXB_0938 [Bacillus sp. OxB-1]|uniref:CxxH/CxxC protein n=1 Tax=Bacillus sp. (strain OxB-1) TaxID=98228 RepID=UPI0005823996|nr:CxxH/CxxC protein [Bacillus sp. OxB-1]BAQ09410.1 hypothetical protein OXB_0938 [Bacillus sp. OxB-1]